MTRIDQPLLTDSDALWREFGADLLRFATVLVGPADAHDVAVEAFLRAAESIARGGVVSPRQFLMRAVSNQAHDLRRSRERRWKRDLAAVGPASAREPDPLVDVRRAVNSLSLAQRTVVYFAYWEDLTERDIASVLAVSPGTVRRHLVRARIHLRRSLQ
jgi:RNA polymerase sigma-70 factor (ECF subfamily)